MLTANRCKMLVTKLVTSEARGGGTWGRKGGRRKESGVGEDGTTCSGCCWGCSCVEGKIWIVVHEVSIPPLADYVLSYSKAGKMASAPYTTGDLITFNNHAITIGNTCIIDSPSHCVSVRTHYSYMYIWIVCPNTYTVGGGIYVTGIACEH